MDKRSKQEKSQKVRKAKLKPLKKIFYYLPIASTISTISFESNACKTFEKEIIVGFGGLVEKSNFILSPNISWISAISGDATHGNFTTYLKRNCYKSPDIVKTGRTYFAQSG